MTLLDGLFVCLFVCTVYMNLVWKFHLFVWWRSANTEKQSITRNSSKTLIVTVSICQSFICKLVSSFMLLLCYTAVLVTSIFLFFCLYVFMCCRSMWQSDRYKTLVVQIIINYFIVCVLMFVTVALCYDCVDQLFCIFVVEVLSFGII